MALEPVARTDRADAGRTRLLRHLKPRCFLVEKGAQALHRLRAASVFGHESLDEQAVIVGHVLHARQAVRDREIGKRSVLADYLGERFRLGQRDEQAKQACCLVRCLLPSPPVPSVISLA